MTATSDVVRSEVFIEAPPETIWRLLSDPRQMERWCGESVTLEAKPGGAYRVVISPIWVMAGSIVEALPNERLTIAWGWEGEGSPIPPGASTVTISLTREGNGTRVVLEHRGLPEPAREKHGEGWAHYLGRLHAVASGGDPGPDPMAQMPAESSAG